MNAHVATRESAPPRARARARARELFLRACGFCGAENFRCHVGNLRRGLPPPAVFSAPQSSQTRRSRVKALGAADRRLGLDAAV